jgi:exopolyphosphatase/guanosine-5'-triphosphate,3'-diphosphate pyrophosphatase
VEEVLAFATSAIREAANGEDVIASVQREAGVPLEVLTGEDEARITFLAVRRWYGWSAGRLLVLDIGGGSLEVAAGTEEDPDAAISVPLGAGRLTRDWLPGDPPSAEDVRAARKHIRTTFARDLRLVTRGGEPDRVVGTSKTFRSLARITGAAPSGEGPYVRRKLRHADLAERLPGLARMSVTERASLSGVSLARAPQLLAGALVADAAMDLLGVSEVHICPWALREGVILRYLDRLGT